MGHRGDLLEVDSRQSVDGAAGQAMPGGHGQAGLLLGDEERPQGWTVLCLAPQLPHRLVEDVLHRRKVLARRHLVEQAPKLGGQGRPFGFGHLPEESGGGNGMVSLGALGPLERDEGFSCFGNEETTKKVRV